MCADPTGTDRHAELVEIVDGAYAWVQGDGTWWVNNAGAVAGGEGTVLIDTCATHRRTTALLRAVDTATGGAAVRWAVNTHQHGDHTYGNSLLPDEAVLVGHENMRAALLADPFIDGCPPFWSPTPQWGQVTRRVPSVTVRDSLTVHSGRQRVELRHPGHPAHTDGDLVAWLPDQRVLYAGDLLFHGLTPLVFMGSLDGALRALDWLNAFAPDHVVPGHGPLIAAGELSEVLAAHERYYRLVQRIADDGAARGETPLQAATGCDLGDFAAWADAERVVLNLHRAYADAAGIALDLPAAFGDAVTWNQGLLATHV